MHLHHIAGITIPAARTADLVTTESNDEVLVYDETVHHIHHLNATAATVWRLCDGERTVGEIMLESGLDAEAVVLALRTLEDAQLLDESLHSKLRGTQSRRSLVKRVGIAAVPAIVSISAPTAKAAASGTCGDTCTQTKDGKPGRINSNGACVDPNANLGC